MDALWASVVTGRRQTLSMSLVIGSGGVLPDSKADDCYRSRKKNASTMDCGGGESNGAAAADVLTRTSARS